MTPERTLSAMGEATRAVHLFMPPHKPPHEYMNRGLLPLTPLCANLGAKGARVDDTTGLRHVLWMAPEVEQFIRAERLGKAFRWLGFAQGVLWMTGAISIDDGRRANMPPEIGGFEEARI